MSIHGPSGLAARIIQVLKDYLPAELDLIDTEEGGLTTPDIAANAYHEWDRKLVTAFPAVTMAIRRGRPLEVLPVNFGSRSHAIYEVDLFSHVLAGGSDDGLRLQDLCFRYSTGMYRVLTILKTGLETAADPVRRVQMVRSRSFDWGPTEEQATGTIVRTAVTGIDVEKLEAR
jgi:hypothetical protein